MSKLRIEGVPGSLGSQFKVSIDDVELDYIQSVSLYLKAGELGEASLEISLDSVEVDGEFMTYLEGHITDES